MRKGSGTRGKSRLALAKVTVPLNTKALAREHLFEQLDSLREHQITWITAPAGSGKTTLLSTYLDAREIPCLWYHVDMGDNDPATFFHYLGLAALSAVPRSAKDFTALTPEYLPGLPTFTLRFFEDLCSFLLSHDRKTGRKNHKQDNRITLVFDNCQEVLPDSLFHAIIMTGLTRIPSCINVFLISRTSPPPAYARLQANAQLGLLGWNDLQLSQTETEQIIRMRYHQNASEETIAHIHQVTQGWAAGLTLMLDELKREGIDMPILHGSTPEEIMYYFGSELFDRLDGTTKDFLMQTAFLPKMTVEMARDLTGIPESGRILASLYRNNYFIHKHIQIVSSYEYHPLFREFLVKMAREQLSPAAFEAVIRRAAVILETSGQAEAAMDLLRRISDWDAMAPFIIENAPGLISQGRFHTLQEWLSPIPDKIMERHPWLVYWKGASLLPFDTSGAKKAFEQAFESFASVEDRTGQLFCVCGIMESIQLSFADFKQYDPWIPVIEHLFQSEAEIHAKEIEARLLDGMVTALVLRQPDHPEIVAWVNRAAALLEQSIPITLKARLIHAVLFYYILQFDVSKMDLVYDQLRAVIASHDIPIVAHLLMYLMEANFHVIKGNHAECLRAVCKGMDIARESGVHIMDHFFQCHAATSFLNENDTQKAREFLEPIAGRYDALSPWERKAYHQVKAREALMRKDGSQAYLHACKTVELITQLGLKVHVALGQYILAQALHMLGRHDEEHKTIAASMAETHLIEKTTHGFYVILLKAICTLDRGDEQAGLTLLREAFTFGRAQGHLGTYNDIPSETARLCALALDADIEPEYVRSLILKRRLVPDKPPLTVENWPWPVKIHTLGRFGLVLDGKPVTFSHKAQQRPLAMLKVLLALGGREIREDQVADFLWPDTEGDSAHHAFDTTLYRLRKLLGRPEALSFREGRITLDPRYCWVDAWAFERLLGEAEACRHRHAIERACSLTEKAVVLYHGGFLESDADEPWMVTLSERLRSKFLQGVRYLAQCRADAGKWEKAAEHYTRCLDVDDCVEEVYQHLMLCYQQLGRRGEALAVYRRCERTFKTFFGVEPSPALKRLRAELIAEN